MSLRTQTASLSSQDTSPSRSASGSFVRKQQFSSGAGLITMPKSDNGKRKINASEVAPNAKRQKAANALKTPKKKALKANKPPAFAATRKPHEADASMQDLPDNVLANVFCALGLDRLRAMQGKTKGDLLAVLSVVFPQDLPA